MNFPLLSSIILLVGLVGGKAAKLINLPSVTGYILFGLAIGPSFLNIVSKEAIESLQFINHLALGILSISIGAELHRFVFRKFGWTLFMVSLGDGLITFGLTTLLTYALGASLEIALILGILSLTVSPSGVLSIVKEYRAKGRFVKNVSALVAIENLNCIVLFGVVTAIIQGVSTTDTTGLWLFMLLLVELIGAIIVGIISGYLIAFFIKKKMPQSKLLVFILGVILFNTGISLEFNLSAILINMSAGAVVTNIINRKLVLLSTMERVELPIFIFFLTLAGAKLDLSILSTVGVVGVGYIVGRLFGKIVGSYISTKPTRLTRKMRKNIGLALTPQAGVAIGLSIIAEQKIPSSNGLITAVLLTGVIFFEIVGPLLLKKSLKNVGAIKS